MRWIRTGSVIRQPLLALLKVSLANYGLKFCCYLHSSKIWRFPKT